MCSRQKSAQPFFLHREYYSKFRSRINITYDFCFFPMKQSNVFDYRQSQPGTAKFTAAGFIHTVEAFKKPVMVFPSNANAVIF
jgi:hypothetical protein